MTEKGKCILAYVLTWLGGLIVLYGMKDNTKETKFHAAQAIVIGVGYFVLYFIANLLPILFLHTAIWVVYILAVVFGIIKACNEENPELPVIGNIAKSIFGKKIEE